MNTTALVLFNLILALFPSRRIRECFQAHLASLLKADGYPRPQHASGKSPSSLSRFFNEYTWSLLAVIRFLRLKIEERLKDIYKKKPGRRPKLDIIIDLTTLEKTGKFPGLPLSTLNKVFGLHLIVLYLVVGDERYPWSFRIWKGKGSKYTPVQLALQQIRCLPKWMSEMFETRVMADGGFGTVDFIMGCEKMKYPLFVTIRNDRKLTDGRSLSEIGSKGECVMITECSVPLYMSWFMLKREDGRLEIRYIASTRRLSGDYIAQVGRLRWRIEGFFKVMKSRFGLDQFGQRTMLGVIRYLVLCFVGYILSSWERVADKKGFIDWQETANQLRLKLTPWVVACEAVKMLEQLSEAIKKPIDEIFNWQKLRDYRAGCNT
jgi:hypothetical protein